ncbi:DUF2059 domain-containing protein [Limoniibacter endophyticus]|uniref:DUF2059 domain-containing protein n=1 Tax=Limoniibacter endophyticus TaxID=1565040 RepID=A0A8J3DIU6_9HYPH|nr:DUF2059 domain-containing protein [Limoniibacter endophyticus]GHC75904.1 hypothetical protein GCM10010136_26290 [Limoniibacter endophyticus]
MIFASRIRTLALSAVAVSMLGVSVATAQEISSEHLAAARATINAINATDQFDNVLPQSAQFLKNELINRNPDKQDLIVSTVDEEIIKIAARRADLEREAATAYARVFSQQELTEIANFYNSATGKKLLSEGPIVSRSMLEAAAIWQRGIARDLTQAVENRLGGEIQPTSAPAQPAPAQ